MQWYQGLTEPRSFVEMNLTNQEEWIGYDKLEVLPEFYYLSDMLSAGKAASWVWSHAVCVHGTGLATYSLFSPTTICLCWLKDGCFLFVWFDSLRPINSLSVIKGRVFLGWTSTKLGLMFLLKDTTQWRRRGSNLRPFGLESSTLPLSHCAPSRMGVFNRCEEWDVAWIRDMGHNRNIEPPKT